MTTAASILLTEEKHPAQEPGLVNLFACSCNSSSLFCCFFSIVCVFVFSLSKPGTDILILSLLQWNLILSTCCQISLSLPSSRVFGTPPQPSASSSGQPQPAEPWLRNRLRDKLAFWKTFCTSVFVISIITSGYQLPWSDGPPAGPRHFANHPSAREHSAFVSEAVSTLVLTGAAMEVFSEPFIVSPLGVVPKGIDKLRLILDLRYVNSFLQVDKFKYESIKEVSTLCKLRDLLFTVDLKSGYHHVDIHPEFWQYFGFEWEGRFYVFCQLPFGLATACFVFTKIIKQLVQRWRRLGIRLIPYIDDFIFFASSAQEFAQAQAQVLADFAAAGFVLAQDKCQLHQSFVAKFLGFIIDTMHGVFRLSARQKTKLQDAISECLSAPSRIPAKSLARITGFITSLSLVTGPVSGLFSRSLHRVLSSRTSWRSILSLDQPALTELRFWRDSLEQFSSRPIWRDHSLVLVLNYDAGADGWGGHFLLHGVEQRARGVWAHDERHGVKSSTWRELEGLRRLLLSVGHLLRGHRVLARGDAMNVFWLLKKGGSRAEHLHSICLRIFWLCLELRIELLPEWVPRAQNQLADFLSKVRDVDDFSLQPGIFQQILRAFSPLHIDRFASSYNAQLPIFWSDLWSPHSAGANAFTDSWAGLRNYCFPPPRLVARVLEHARECSAEIVLVVLDWPGQPWWPLLVRDRGRAWAPFVRHALWFPPGPSTFRSGRGSADAFFGHGFPSCAVHVLDISFW